MQNKINKQKACPQCLKHSFCRRGFTIIETMISVSLFIVVVMAGMGALLNANLLQQKSQDMRSIMDNLSFIMEDMSRNLRTGMDYHCMYGESVPPALGYAPSPKSCPTSPVGGGISFKSNPFTGQWTYYIASNPNDSAKLRIFKSVDDGTTVQTVQLTPDEVDIGSASSFIVLGAEPPLTPTLISGSNPPKYTYNCSVPNDCQQPFVTIKLVGTISSKGITTPFSLQTSVSQRRIDR